MNYKLFILLLFLLIMLYFILLNQKKIEKFGEEKNDNYYNEIYKSSIQYKKNPKELKEYFKSWKFCSDLITKKKFNLILDIGCGPGHLPEVLSKFNNNFKYIGFDFSKVAIDMARKRNKKKKLVFMSKTL